MFRAIVRVFLEPVADVADSSMYVSVCSNNSVLVGAVSKSVCVVVATISAVARISVWIRVTAAIAATIVISVVITIVATADADAATIIPFF